MFYQVDDLCLGAVVINLFWPKDHLFKKIPDRPFCSSDTSWTSSPNCIAYRSVNSRARLRFSGTFYQGIKELSVDHEQIQMDHRWSYWTTLRITFSWDKIFLKEDIT